MEKAHQTLRIPRSLAGDGREFPFAPRRTHMHSVRLPQRSRLWRPAETLWPSVPSPPTRAYGGAYAPLDAILGQNELSAESPALPDLLAACEHISCLVLSYGGPTASLGQLSNIVGRYRQVATALAVPYTHLKSIASEEKRATDREYLIVAKT